MKIKLIIGSLGLVVGILGALLLPLTSYATSGYDCGAYGGSGYGSCSSTAAAASSNAAKSTTTAPAKSSTTTKATTKAKSNSGSNTVTNFNPASSPATTKKTNHTLLYGGITLVVIGVIAFIIFLAKGAGKAAGGGGFGMPGGPDV